MLEDLLSRKLNLRYCSYEVSHGHHVCINDGRKSQITNVVSSGMTLIASSIKIRQIS